MFGQRVHGTQGAENDIGSDETDVLLLVCAITDVAEYVELSSELNDDVGGSGSSSRVRSMDVTGS